MAVAYKNHNRMILISIQPFAFRKIFVLVVALLGLSSAACFADSLFMTLHPRQYKYRSTDISQVFSEAKSGTLCETCGASGEPMIGPFREGKSAIDSAINRMSCLKAEGNWASLIPFDRAEVQGEPEAGSSLSFP
ncbi:MAG: hypothetical protein QOE34_2542 [Verrucomicrobiota bacterium]|jgi:hypothetical protein